MKAIKGEIDFCLAFYFLSQMFYFGEGVFFIFLSEPGTSSMIGTLTGEGELVISVTVDTR